MREVFTPFHRYCICKKLIGEYIAMYQKIKESIHVKYQ
jgi:hypothetical protein